jgi:hypothetical protein
VKSVGIALALSKSPSAGFCTLPSGSIYCTALYVAKENAALALGSGVAGVKLGRGCKVIWDSSNNV